MLSPRSLMPSKLFMPPVLYCRGTSPIDAAKSRPQRYCLPSPTSASNGRSGGFASIPLMRYGGRAVRQVAACAPVLRSVFRDRASQSGPGGAEQLAHFRGIRRQCRLEFRFIQHQGAVPACNAGVGKRSPVAAVARAGEVGPPDPAGQGADAGEQEYRRDGELDDAADVGKLDVQVSSVSRVWPPERVCSACARTHWANSRAGGGPAARACGTAAPTG